MIDDAAALELNQKMYDDVKNDRSKWKPRFIDHPYHGMIPNGEVVDPFYSYQSQQFALRRFARREFTYSISSSRRLYSGLGSLKKVFRQFVSCEGMPLVELDCSNCQPYLILGTWDDRFWTNEHDYFNVKDIRQHHITNRYSKVLNSSYFSWNKYSTMLRTLAETLNSQGFQRYQHDVCNGNFYKGFYDRHWNSPGKDNLYIDPFFDGETYEEATGCLKVGILKYINAHHRWNSPIKIAFKQDYPEVHELLMTLKKAGRKNDMSIFMQSIESALFLFRIARRFAVEYPECPLYSIHDCLITVYGFEDILQAIMIDEFTKCIGVPPMIKIKYWFHD